MTSATPRASAGTTKRAAGAKPGKTTEPTKRAAGAKPGKTTEPSRRAASAKATPASMKATSARARAAKATPARARAAKATPARARAAKAPASTKATSARARAAKATASAKAKATSMSAMAPRATSSAKAADATSKRASKPATTIARPQTDAVLAAELLEKVRAFCAALPGVTEKLSHGAPTFFIKAGTFANFCDNHHGDGKIAVWCAAPEGAQAMLVDSQPEHYFVPAYVGHMGWVGMRLDRGLVWSQVEATLEAAHAARSLPRPRRPR